MDYVKPGKFSDAVAAQRYIENKLRKKQGLRLNNYLKELGKYSAFVEEFENVALDAQDLPKIESIDDITTNEHFIAGRKFGYTLIQNGFDAEKYLAYKQERETSKHR